MVSLVAIMIYATIQFADAKSAAGGILYVEKWRGLLRDIRFALTNSQSETIGEFWGRGGEILRVQNPPPGLF